MGEQKVGRGGERRGEKGGDGSETEGQGGKEGLERRKGRERGKGRDVAPQRRVLDPRVGHRRIVCQSLDNSVEDRFTL